MVGGTVEIAVPVAEAFAYLADPRTRPQWQSSLRRVELIDEGPPRLGMRWRDHTVLGLVPELRITAFEPDGLWAEEGRWHGVRASLMLELAPTASGCTVEVGFRIDALGPLGRLLAPVVRRPVLADVRRAARILERR